MKQMFTSMVKVVPEGERGIAKVSHFEVDDHASTFSALRREYVPPGRYARLTVNGALVMSDTWMEHRTNVGVVVRANGDVLIAGLGLGMILKPILAKPEVRSVTVVEKYRDVIDLVGPHFKSRKLTIVCADIFDWKPARKFDTIYFDIWADKCTDNLEEIAKLHQRFKYHLNRDNPERWMDSWCAKELRAERRSDNSRYW